MNKVILFDIWGTLLHRREATFISKISNKYDIPFKSLRQRVKTDSTICSIDVLYNYLNKEVLEGVNLEDLKKIENCSRFDFYFKRCTFSVLKKIKEIGYDICTVSNATYITRNILESLEFKFDYNFLSYEYGYLKPDIRFFNEILNQLKIKENHVIMIGNDYKKDIEPTLNLGMKSILLNNDKNYYKNNIIQINSLQELINYL